MEHGRSTHPNDEGFTLVELLVVIIVLGVLATITVFAVRGIVDQGEDSAEAADERTLVTAEEAHQARFNSYASETELVETGLLSSESSAHDIDLISDGSDYEIVGEGMGTTVPPVTIPVTTPVTPTEPTIPSTAVPGPATTLVPTPHTLHPVDIAGFSGQAYGSGPNRIVIISDGTSFLANWNQIVAEGAVLPTTEVIWLGTGDVNTGPAVEAIIATDPRLIVAAANVAITNPDTYVGQYLDDRPGDLDFWWGHQQGGLSPMLNYYTTTLVPGG